MNDDSRIKVRYPNLLKEPEIESILRRLPRLKSFWKINDGCLVFRGQATLRDPVYEIQLIINLGERMETYGWVWIDAIDGKILRIHPD